MMTVKRNNINTTHGRNSISFPRFEHRCYKICPEKTYREEFECKACDTNCGNCDQNACYWCEEGFFLLGKPKSESKV